VIVQKCFSYDFKQILTPEDASYNDEIYVRLPLLREIEKHYTRTELKFWDR
jgi:hypothetical protein